MQEQAEARGRSPGAAAATAAAEDVLLSAADSGSGAPAAAQVRWSGFAGVAHVSLESLPLQWTFLARRGAPPLPTGCRLARY